MLVLTFTPELSAKAVEAAVGAGDVAAVVLRLAGGAAPAPERLRAVADAAQRLGAAVLVEGPVDLIPAAGLDGVHVNVGDVNVGDGNVSDMSAGVSPGLAAALGALKPQAIVGAGGLLGRHDAMLVGESGADYVFFGALDGAGGEFARGQFAQVLDLVAWWSDLFEVPCVGLAASLEEVESLARAGADFVALSEALVASGPEAIAAAQARLVPREGA